MATSALPLLLVIAPDAEIRDFYRSLFENDGWAVAAIPSPEPTLAWVRSYQPSAVVLDVSSDSQADPSVDYLRRLRDDHATADLPVVFCTADQGLVEKRREQIATLGAKLLATPFDLDDLISAIPQPVAGARSDA